MAVYNLQKWPLGEHAETLCIRLSIQYTSLRIEKVCCYVTDLRALGCLVILNLEKCLLNLSSVTDHLLNPLCHLITEVAISVFDGALLSLQNAEHFFKEELKLWNWLVSVSFKNQAQVVVGWFSLKAYGRTGSITNGQTGEEAQDYDPTEVVAMSQGRCCD